MSNIQAFTLELTAPPRRRSPLGRGILVVLAVAGACTLVSVAVLRAPIQNRNLGLLKRLYLPERASYPDSLPLSGPLAPLLHDPSLCVAPTGGGKRLGKKRATGKVYTLVSTGFGIPIRTSTDRVNWIDAGVVWPNSTTPTATNSFTGQANGNLWAPDIHYVAGRGYFLYYSASKLGSQNSGIFLAWSATGAQGTWQDRGLVIQSSTAVDWNAIDPNLAIDANGAWWLALGSYWSGIKLISLDPVTGKQTQPNTMRSISRRPGTGAETAEEGSFLYRYGKYWYLFTSWGSCCAGKDSTYSVHVTRSSAIIGPYVSKNGTAALNGGGDVILASHGSIILDSDGPVMVYAYSADLPRTYHIGLNRLDFASSGWPVVV